MAANKKPRKKYVPKRNLTNPLAFVLEGVKPLEHDRRTTLRIINHAALAALVRGEGSHDDWQQVCSAINMAIAFAEMGLGTDYIPEIRQAMRAHAECGSRLHRHGKFGYSGTELQAVNLVMDVHDAQLEEAAVQQIETAGRIVKESIRRKNFYVSVKEIVNERPSLLPSMEPRDSGAVCV
jgi:hypothetical protein